MGDRQINLGLNFNVNKQNLDAVQKSLDAIIAKAQQLEKAAPDYASDFREAGIAAKDFKNILSGSWNAQIGQLNFKNVEQSLINLYGSTKNFKTILKQIGPEAQTTFNTFSRAILQTQLPVKKTSEMLDKMAITFKNTIRYGISSSIWNNFSNSVQKAYSYVKDLDRSLNDIRIVSGQSADEMERLAIQANKTAQALGTSTLDYTKAALIYYQQGLSGSDVEERAEVTLKMANVLGSSAQDISSYMTAIWNNFDKGSESLEHYADVITALGASTASSSEEIATGLQKFAAVANTVGLSYEYATSALATVVAQTRQSADTVGTAFKTLFSRIQDLELGKTLDDGVTLGTYAEALRKIGVNIKDSRGELKKMDTILEEMGSKWDTLNDAQKIALAQNVAGIRQYTQLIALMDNWDKFQTNLGTANSAEGTLQSQQEIYLDSIEAHLEKMNAAWEGLYKTIFDEDALKFFTDALTKVINLANTFATGLGGGLNSILYIVMTLGNVFSKNISQELIRMKQNADQAKAALEAVAAAQRLSAEADPEDVKARDIINSIGNEEYLKRFQIDQKLIGIKADLNKSDQEILNTNEQILQTYEKQDRILTKILAHDRPDASNLYSKANMSKKKWDNLSDEDRNALITQKLEEFQQNGKKPAQWRIDDANRRISQNEINMLKSNKILTAFSNNEILSQSQNKMLTGNITNVLTKEKDIATSMLRQAKKDLKETDNEEYADFLKNKIDAEKKYIKTIQDEIGALKELNKWTAKRKTELDNVEKGSEEYNRLNKIKYEDELEDISKVNDALVHYSGIRKKQIETEKEGIKELQEYRNIKTEDEFKKKIAEDRDKNRTQQKIIWENKNEFVNQDEMVKQTQEVVSGLFTAGTTLSSFIGTFKTALDSNIDGWEKVKSIFTVLTTQSLIIAKNWGNVKNLLPNIFEVAKKRYVLMQGEVLMQQLKNKELSQEQYEQAKITLEESLQNKYSFIELLTLIKQNVQLKIKNALSSPLGKVVAVAAIVAATAALGYWITKLIIGQSEEEKLREQIEETQKVYAKSKEEYQNLKDSISGYTDAKKGLDSLTEGTVEFYEAVMTANEKAQTLIDTLNLIAGKDYSIDVSTGLISINENVLQDALFKKQQETFRAQTTNLMAKLDLSKYYKEQTIEDFQKAVGNKSLVRFANSVEAEKILNKEVNNLELIAETIDGNLTRTTDKIGLIAPMLGMNQTWTADITDEVGTFRAQYNKYSAEILATQKQIASSMIQGYGTKEQIEEYQKATKAQQEIINAYVAKQSNTGDLKLEDLESMAWRDFFVGGGAKTYPGTMGHWSKSMLEDYIRKQYAQNVLKYEYNPNLQTWSDSEGRTITQEDLEKIDYKTALVGNYSGQSGKTAIDNIFDFIENFKNQSSLKNINTDSLDYITEAATAMLTGENYQYQYLTPEEIDLLKNSLDEMGASIEGVDLKSQEFWQHLKEQSSEEIRLQQDMARYDDELYNQAKALDVSKNALKAYDVALQNVNKSEDEYSRSAAKAAADTYKFNKAYNTGRKAFENNKDAWNEYVDALQKGVIPAYDVADAAGAILDELEKIGIVLNKSQLKDSQVLKNINKLFTGTAKEAEKAYQELEKLSVSNMWDTWNAKVLESGNLTSDVLKQIQQDITSLNEDEIINGDNFKRFREYIENAKMSYEELIQFLDANHIKYTIDDIEKLDVVANDIPGTKTVQTHTLNFTNGLNPYTGQPQTTPITWEETVETKASQFYTLKEKANISKGGATNRSFAPASSSSSKKSSSGSSNKPNKMEKVETEIDRYHKVNTQITKIDNSLKKLQSQEEKYLGTNLIDNLIKQWQLLNIQIDNYTEKLKIANEEQEELATKLSKKGVLFNDDGTIKNYAEAIKAQENYVNSLIDKYNAMSKSQQESYKETVEAAKKEFDKFKTNIDRYDELVSNFIPQLQQNIQDSIDKQIELNVKKFNLEIDVTLNLNQATRDWNAWARRALQGFADADIFGKSQARLKDFYTYFNDNIGGDIQKSAKHVNEILQELYRMDRGEENVYGDNRAKGIEELKDKYTELMGQITDVIELQDELHQNWLDKMDEVQEKFSEQINSYQFLREILSHDLKVVELAFGADSYAEMAKFYEQQQNNYEKQLEFQRQQKDFWYAQMQAVENGTEEWDKAKEKWEDAVKEFNKILEEGLQNAIDKFKNAINAIFKELNNSITGGLGLEFIQTEWDLINKNADRYLDTINATYAVRQLEKKYTDVINKTNSITQQQKLKKVMDEQLAAIKEKEKLTQYDIDRANKLYEIELARITLEEARNNKSQMRLRRDSQGNYRYQYVADLDAIKQAEDNLDNLYNSLYNFDKDKYNNTLNDIYTSWNEYQQKMAEAALINDPQLRAEKQMLIQQEYNELLMQLEDEYQISKYNLQESFFNDWVKLNDMELEQFKLLNDNEKNIIMTEMIPTWESGLSQMAEAFSGDEGFAKVTIQSWEEIKTSQQGYADDIAKLEEVSKQTFDTIVQGEDDAIVKSEALIEENQAIIDKYSDELDAVKKCYDEVNKLIDAHKKEMETAKKAAEEAYNYYKTETEMQQKAYEQSEKLRTSTNATADALAKANTIAQNANKTSSSSTGSSGNSGNSSNGSSSKSSSGSTSTKTQTVTYTITLDYGYDKKTEKKTVTKGNSITLPSISRSGYKFNGWDIPSLGICTNGSYSYKPTKNETVKAIWTKQSTVTTVVGAAASAATGAVSGILSKLGLKTYDTGGYTGTWDNSGKLAMLHQKELVLNQSDTKNMLNAVSIMRNLTGTLGTELLARLSNISTPNYNNGNLNSSLLEQNVHIDATFPNVKNASEIEEALNNLVNSASQRIYENSRR